MARQPHDNTHRDLPSLSGCAFVFLAIQLRALPPFTIVLLRVGLAFLNNVIPFARYGFAQQTIASGLAGICHLV